MWIIIKSDIKYDKKLGYIYDIDTRIGSSWFIQIIMISNLYNNQLLPPLSK